MEENEIYQWISNIIYSCKHDFQLECADNLIELFSKRTGNTALADSLRLQRDTKYSLIHGL
jgi:hypothetical protein